MYFFRYLALLLQCYLSFAALTAVDPALDEDSAIIERQDNVNSTCITYGVDFANGGKYFLNKATSQDFTFVSQFEGCNDDMASALLVNMRTSDQYECTPIPTTFDLTSQMSTCPISKNAMTSGKWTIILTGNNGDGAPFAYQRTFRLKVRPQQTTTITPTITGTITTTPISLPFTTPVFTGPATNQAATSTLTFTLPWWTTVQITSTNIVTASCTVPSLPQWPDTFASIVPTIFPWPEDLRLPARVHNNVAGDQQVMTLKDADQPVVTVTAKTPKKRIVTVTAAPITKLHAATQIAQGSPKATTDSRLTVTPTPTSTDYLDQRDRGNWNFIGTVYTYSTVYAITTYSFTWQYTMTTTPSAASTACQQSGGHFGTGWGFF